MKNVTVCEYFCYYVVLKLLAGLDEICNAHKATDAAFIPVYMHNKTRILAAK